MKIVLIPIFLLSCCIMGQVSIGKSSVSNTSVSLEFGIGNRGFLLPWVSSSDDIIGSVNGTMAYDLTDHKVKVKYASGWKDLSNDTTGSTVDPITSIDGVLMQNSLQESFTAKVSIGSSLSATPGILVLEDTDKAMILPKVAAPHLNIINPSAGMIVYDTTVK